MYIMTYLLLGFLSAFILSLLLGSILIPILHKFKINQSLSIYLSERHESKKNTPTMGGLIFIISTLIIIFIFLLFNKISITYNFIIVIFTFL